MPGVQGSGDRNRKMEWRKGTVGAYALQATPRTNVTCMGDGIIGPHGAEDDRRRAGFLVATSPPDRFAKANGVSLWAGYFSDGNDGIYGGGWSDATFKLVQAGGLQTLAFCSYRADAATWKARAEALGIVLVLDVERSVDGGDGPAVDPWLAASGARLYGCGPGAGCPT